MNGNFARFVQEISPLCYLIHIATISNEIAIKSLYNAFMPFASEQTFKDYLRNILSRKPNVGGKFGYWPLTNPLNGLGVKATISETCVSSRREALLAGVSNLVIHEDPLEGLRVGQQIAFAGDSELRLHLHEPNSGTVIAVNNQNYFPNPFQSREVTQGKKALRNIARISNMSDESLRDWLQISVDLDKRSYAADTKGNNLLYSPDRSGLKWIDVDDPRFSGDSDFTAENHNHLAALMSALEIRCRISPYLFTLYERNATSQKEYYNAAVQEEWYKLYDRLTLISKSIGLPLNAEEYIAQNKEAEKTPRPATPIIIEEIPMDSSIMDVARALSRYTANAQNTKNQSFGWRK